MALYAHASTVLVHIIADYVLCLECSFFCNGAIAFLIGTVCEQSVLHVCADKLITNFHYCDIPTMV